MDIQQYINHKKNNYDIFLRWIDSSCPDDFQSFLSENKIPGNNAELREFFSFLVIISNFHYRNKLFFGKIKDIIFFNIEKINQNIPKADILDICIESKQIVLLLLESNIITQEDLLKMLNQKDDIEYKCFFYSEIKNIITEKDKNRIEAKISDFDSDLLIDFETYRQKGENHRYICSLIREDLIKEFITYVDKCNLDVSTFSIKPSIFETNSILQSKKEVSLIEYASFFGSIKIYLYLKYRNVKATPSLMLFAIHSRNSKLIHLIENDLGDDLDVDKYIEESIKCHHNELVDYFINNYIHKIDLLSISLKYHNFHLITKEEIDNKYSDLFYYSCKYDYETFLHLLIELGINIDPQKLEGSYDKNQYVMQILLNNNLIGIDKFRDCTKIRNLTIPSFITKIDESSFSRCTELLQITIPSSVESINKNAFERCKSLTKVEIPSSVKYIGSYAFFSCSSLKEITIPSSVESIMETTFAECESLTKVEIPSSVKYIGSCAFANCSSLEEITIPSSVESIMENVFAGCESLIKVEIPSSVNMIKEYTFANCTSLKEITIPSSVELIMGNAFQRCKSLIKIEIPSSVNMIKEYAFADCSSLKEITIPSSVNWIYHCAFINCSSLKEVTVPSSVESIMEYTFTGCKSLTKVEIPSSVNTIKMYAFADCSSLKEITIPSSVDKIEKGAFLNCSSLTRVKLPDDISEISDYLFFNCSSLSEVELPDNLKTIGIESFYGCISLTRIEMPKNLSKIFEYAFLGCSSLKEFIVHSQIHIYNFAFWGCPLIDQDEFSCPVKCDKFAFDDCLKLSCIIEKPCPTQSNENIPDLNDYDIQSVIKDDSYKTILKAINKNTGKDVAIKIHKHKHHVNVFFQYAITNIGIPGILKVQNYHILTHNFDFDENDVKKKIGSVYVSLAGYFIIQDFMKNGNLKKNTELYLNSQGTYNSNMNPTIRSKIIFGIAAIMEILHNLDVFHQHLTMNNILLDDNFEPLINNLEYSGFSVLPTNGLNSPAWIHNDLIYCSPECFRHEILTVESDVYSYGIILYLMFTDYLKPVETKNKMAFHKHVMCGYRFARPDNIPDHYWKLINECWEQIPSNRPSFEYIKNLLKDDIFALEEFGMKTDLDQLHEYQKKFDFDSAVENSEQ